MAGGGTGSKNLLCKEPIIGHFCNLKVFFVRVCQNYKGARVGGCGGGEGVITLMRRWGWGGERDGFMGRIILKDPYHHMPQNSFIVLDFYLGGRKSIFFVHSGIPSGNPSPPPPSSGVFPTWEVQVEATRVRGDNSDKNYTPHMMSVVHPVLSERERIGASIYICTASRRGPVPACSK